MGDDTRNEFAGTARNVVQAENIYGGVHIQQASPDWLVVPRQLPPDTAHFTDRDAHLASLHGWLDAAQEQAASAAVITGSGGVGKTSLATHWAHQVRERFTDGDIYLDLRGYHSEHALSSEDAVEELLEALNTPGERVPPGMAARVALYRSLLHGRRILLLLDNAASVEQVRPLLPGTSTCRLLVTSRGQLGGLVVRDGAQRMSLDVLEPEDAIGLLERISDSERVQEDPAATAELVRYCGYLPLALRIAAERLVNSPSFSVADLVAELAEARERLDALHSEDEDAEVRAVFSWSYHALAPDVARMFRLLGLVPGPDISVEAVATLAGISVVKARRQLDKLVGAHLLNETGSRRYRFHDLLRVYAAECAEADEPEENRKAALHRLFTWYAYSTNAAAFVITPHFSRIPVDIPEPEGPVPEFPDRLTALHWCDAEQDSAVAAVSQAAASGADTRAWQLTVALFAYFLVRKPYKDWVDTHEVGLSAARRDGARLTEAWLYTSISIAHRGLSQHDTALEYLDQALAGWREFGHRWAEAWALRDAGSAYYSLGRNEQAVTTIEQALAIHLAEGDSWGEATALNWLARAHHGLGQLDVALDEMNRALAIRQSQGDQPNVANALNDLCTLRMDLEQFDLAIQVAEQALDISQNVEHWHGEVTAHDRLGTLLDRVGRTESADEHWNAAVELYDKLGDPRADEIRARATR